MAAVALLASFLPNCAVTIHIGNTGVLASLDGNDCDVSLEPRLYYRSAIFSSQQHEETSTWCAYHYSLTLDEVSPLQTEGSDVGLHVNLVERTINMAPKWITNMATSQHFGPHLGAEYAFLVMPHRCA